MTEKKQKRTRESITEEEIATLEAAHVGQDMPDDGTAWAYAGRFYVNASTCEQLWQHPNREFLI